MRKTNRILSGTGTLLLGLLALFLAAVFGPADAEASAKGIGSYSVHVSGSAQRAGL